MPDDTTQLQEGAINWRDRLAREILLTSPSGIQFTAKWKGDPRKKEKKLGIFEFPLVNGNIVQDLDMQSSYYTITIHFDGPNNDINASAFYEACNDLGLWQVWHPVHGYLELQLIRVEEDTSPVESGGITTVSTEWIEPIDEIFLETGRQLGGHVDDLMAEYAGASIMQYEDNVWLDTFGEETACSSTASKIAAETAIILGDVASENDEVFQSWQSSQAGLDDVIAADELDAGSLAGNLRGIIQTPILGSTDIQDRLERLEELIDSIIAGLPTGTSKIDANRAMTAETAMDSALGAACRVVTTGDLLTRGEAVEAAQKLLDLLDKITKALDEIQEQFEELRAELQYYSQTATYQSALDAISAAVAFLLATAFNLAIEKRYILAEPKTPYQIVIEEFGTEDRIDEFISWNKLSGDQILLLPAGYEVVLYVGAA